MMTVNIKGAWSQTRIKATVLVFKILFGIKQNKNKIKNKTKAADTTVNEPECCFYFSPLAT